MATQTTELLTLSIKDLKSMIKEFQEYYDKMFLEQQVYLFNILKIKLKALQRLGPMKDDDESEPEIQVYNLCNLDQDIDFSSSEEESESDCKPDAQGSQDISKKPQIDILNISQKSGKGSDQDKKVQ